MSSCSVEGGVQLEMKSEDDSCMSDYWPKVDESYRSNWILRRYPVKVRIEKDKGRVGILPGGSRRSLGKDRHGHCDVTQSFHDSAISLTSTPPSYTMSAPAQGTSNAKYYKEIRAKFERFRILIIGRRNSGKTTILQRVCNTTDKPLIFDRDGKKVRSRTLYPDWIKYTNL